MSDEEFVQVFFLVQFPIELLHLLFYVLIVCLEWRSEFIDSMTCLCRCVVMMRWRWDPAAFWGEENQEEAGTEKNEGRT
jgi:hypothetical protein